MSADILPFPVHSFLGQISICIIGAIWLIFSLFGLYKLIRHHHQYAFHQSFFSMLDTRSRLLGDNVPEYSSQLASRGLDYHVVLPLPLVMFKEEERREGDYGRSVVPECSICLTEFEDGDWQRVLPNCSHAFHVHCIDTWLCSRSDCPLCRKRVACDVAKSLETLPREDFCRERLLDHRLLESERVGVPNHSRIHIGIE